MEGLDLSMKNKYVKVWIVTVLPAIVLTILLFIFMSREYHFIPIALPIVTIIPVYLWVMMDIKKQRNKEINVNKEKFR